MANSVVQWIARAFVYCYPVSKHYWTLLTLASFSYFLGTFYKGANSLSIVNTLLWGNTFILWSGFIIEGLIRYFALRVEMKIKANPNSNWVTFKTCMPYLLDYLCCASLCVTSAAVLLDGGASVVSVETELVASLVLAVFYMVMAFGKDLGYSPSVSLSGAFLGLIVLRTGLFAAVCVMLFAFTHVVYPGVFSHDFGVCLRSFGDTGRWEVPIFEKKVEKEEVGVEEMPSLIGLLLSPSRSYYQLLVLERLQISLIVCVSVAALSVVFLKSRITPYAAGQAYDSMGTFLELVCLKHVNYKK